MVYCSSGIFCSNDPNRKQPTEGELENTYKIEKTISNKQGIWKEEKKKIPILHPAIDSKCKRKKREGKSQVISKQLLRDQISKFI